MAEIRTMEAEQAVSRRRLDDLLPLSFTAGLTVSYELFFPDPRDFDCTQ